QLIAAFITLVLVTPFTEELIFRGFVFAGFRRRLPFWLAALGVSALFAWIHGQWNVGLDVFVMSLVGCYLIEKTKNLWSAIFLHMLKNGVAFYLVYLYNGS
ncbi:MAG TPA: CPBP family intramembrane glutamic endopeptidase, partial [Magnetospirillaceae bacterium]|nr:CPBP family intramembrane glutamic endopeptidase [Magnetospirillaceae bacterium]